MDFLHILARRSAISIERERILHRGAIDLDT
jgi:hypothetical protein